jgi:hypothetical protein
MAETLSYFDELRKEDGDFFVKVKSDGDDKVENIFWVDGVARAAYKTYNDCISFDNTYLTNIYKMSFAPLIAINRHAQSIQVECRFLCLAVPSLSRGNEWARASQFDHRPKLVNGSNNKGCFCIYPATMLPLAHHFKD